MELKVSRASLRVSSIVLRRRRSSPGASPVTVKNDRPSSPCEPGRRASTTMRSAVWPSSTKLLLPSSRQALPDCVAVMAMPSASLRPSSSEKASVAVVSPEAIAGSSALFCSSVPALRMALAASTVDRKGAHRSPRPISSSTIARSAWPKPPPP